MFIKKVKSEGLAHLSYLIGSEGSAAVVDPRRDCEVYLDIARANEVTIEFILETHRNEDYVTGSRELASLTGAPILHGDNAFGYGQLISEGEELAIGKVKLRALSTPGHTADSMSYAIVDTSAGPEVVGVFTGDTLFVGEVGRTDLFGKDRIEDLASLQYDSLFGKLLPLGDGAIIFPAHGAGSPCGGSIGTREESTIGLEKAQNHALRVKSKEEFVAMKKDEVIEKPFYFSHMEEVNLEGQPLLGHLPTVPPVSPQDLWSRRDESIILDIRAPASYASAQIPGSLNIPLEILPNYAGWTLPYGRPILLVAEEPGQLDPAVRALVRIGYDQLTGHLDGGMEAWFKTALPITRFEATTAKEFSDRKNDMFLLDIRMEKEWREVRAEGAQHIFVGYLGGRLSEVPRGREIGILCSSGLRGSLAASILKNNGYEPVNLLGGMGGWQKAGLPTIR